MSEFHQEKYKSLFFEEARKLVTSVRLLHAGSTGKEDEKVAYRSIHTLKAMSQMMGFDALSEECQKFEMALKEGRLTKEKQFEHIEKLELLVDRLESPPGGARCGAKIHLSIDCFDRTIALLVAIIDAVEELSIERKKKVLGNLKEICSGLLPARLVPFGEIQRYLLRVVSTYQRANNRREELIFQGEDVLLDVNILTDVAGILVHLVRNALSHGIESPEERKVRKKRVEGRIIVSAKKDRKEVIIKVEDDGMGINYEMLKSVAIRKGLLTGNKKAMSDDLNELNRVLFLPGFTTSERLEEFKGFGLGLDAVKEMVNSIDGIIMVSSREGSGTVFTIRIPKRNFYLKTRLFRVGERTVGIEAEPILQVSPERKKGDHKSGRKSGKKVTIDMIRYFEGKDRARFTPVDFACSGREFRILFEKELPTQEILLLEQGNTLFWKGFTKQADVVLVINMDYVVKNY